MSQSGVAVIGGGIVGLASALGAAEGGATVTVFDPKIGSGATYAAAGMLSPGSEFLGGFQPDFENALEALNQWRDLAETLGVAIHRCDTEVVGWSSGDRRDIDRYLSVASSRGVAMTTASSAGLALSPRVSVTAAISNEGFVDVDEVVAALYRKLVAMGVAFRPEKVANIVSTSHGHHVVTASTTDPFDRVLVATGAVQPSFLEGVSTAVQAVRGVTLRVAMTPGPPAMLRGFVDGKNVYVVRRPNGVTVIGATSDLQSNPVVHSRDVQELLDVASMLVPAVQEAEFIDARAGIRPASVDGFHFFDVVRPGVAWTSGYFRHGVLMAPLAASRAKEFLNADR